MAAFAAALALAACQDAGPPDMNAPGQSAAMLMRVADDSRANGDPVTAAHLYRRVHAMRMSDPEPLAKLASTLTQLGSYTDAAQSYRAALDLAPKDPELRRGLAVVLLSLSQPESALAELDKASEQDQNDPRIFNALGVAHDLLGRHDLAQSDYLNGLRLAPKSTGLRNNYGLSLALAGDYGAAASTLGEIANDPVAPPRYRLNLALVYGLAGDDKRAAAIARSALDEASVQSNLAYYATLRAMDDKARTAAIIGGQIHGLPIEPPMQKADDATTPKGTDAAAAATPATPASAETTTPPSAQSANPPTAPVSDAAPEVSGPPVQLAPQPRSDAQTPNVSQADAGVSQADAGTADASTATEAPAAPPATDAVAPSPSTASASPPADAAPAADAEPTPSQPDAAASAAPTPVAPAKPGKGKGSMASAAPAHGFAVQFGSFSVEANAKKLADQLSAKGYHVAVMPHKDGSGHQWFAVRGEGYANAAAAEAAVRHIHDAEKLPAVVVRQPTPGPA